MSAAKTSFSHSISLPFIKAGEAIKNFGGKVKSVALKALDLVAPVNPVSKTRRFRIIPTCVEKALGEVNYNQLAPAIKQVQSTSPEQDRARYHKIVHEVFDSLVEHCECNDKFEYEVRLIEDSQVNAFCLPGGKTVITTGILDKINTLVMNDEKKLRSSVAFIMGHELTHANASHSVGTIAFKIIAHTIGYVAGTILGIFVYLKLDKSGNEAIQRDRNMTPEMKAQKSREVAFRAYIISHFVARVFRFIASAVTYLIERAVSRSHEYEADKHSLTYLKKAGYDYEGARTTMKLFQDLRGKPGKFMKFIENVFSTHPAPDKRLKAIENEIKVLG